MEFEQFWSEIYYGNAGDLKRNFPVYATKILQAILSKLISEGEIHVGLSYYNKDKWSIIAYDDYDKDKQLHIRLNEKLQYELYFYFWNEEGLLEEEIYILKETEVQILPQALRSIMESVLESEQGKTIRKNVLSAYQ